jgi:hypothetical protein
MPIALHTPVDSIRILRLIVTHLSHQHLLLAIGGVITNLLFTVTDVLKSMNANRIKFYSMEGLILSKFPVRSS